jgi:hypothetical protein
MPWKTVIFLHSALVFLRSDTQIPHPLPCDRSKLRFVDLDPNKDDLHH